MDLNDKTVIVTGAGSGLGRAVSIMAAKAGAKIVMADISQSAMDQTEAKIKDIKGTSISCVVDVCNLESIVSMLEKAVETFGKMDALVNCAGIFSSIPFLELTEKDWCRMMDINLKGSFLCTQQFIKRVLLQKTGASIVFLSSISGFIGFTKSAHYCATKGAVRQLSKAIALEFGAEGIRSNVIAPGTIETPMNAWIMDNPKLHRQSVASIPMGRFGQAEEIASAVLFLISNEASYCNGSELLVDGGQITHC